MIRIWEFRSTTVDFPPRFTRHIAQGVIAIMPSQIFSAVTFALWCVGLVSSLPPFFLQLWAIVFNSQGGGMNTDSLHLCSVGNTRHDTAFLHCETFYNTRVDRARSTSTNCSPDVKSFWMKLISRTTWFYKSNISGIDNRLNLRICRVQQYINIPTSTYIVK